MKFYIFKGGRDQLIVKVDSNRNVSLSYPPIFGTEFINEDDVLKQSNRNEVAQYKLKKKNYTDKEFEDYIIKEFTSNKWLGFELINIKTENE